MYKTRFVIDDVGQSRTQRAVLFCLSEMLQKVGAEVVFTSSLSAELVWGDVSPEVSRRLSVRIFSMTSVTAQTTVFLPGHIVPGDVAEFSSCRLSVAVDRLSPVSDWDIFVVNHSSRDVNEYLKLVTDYDYEYLSKYNDFEFEKLPSWLIASGLTSCIKLSSRPWYSANSPLRLQWLEWVSKSLKSNHLTLKMIQDDIGDGLIRPSLVEDVSLISESKLTYIQPDTTLDTLFTIPEFKLNELQFKLLFSNELQERALKFAKSKKKVKYLTAKSFKRILNRFLSLIRRVISVAYRFFFRFLYKTFQNTVIKK